MNEWASTLLGSGLVGTPILTLVLTGRLIPVWVVRKQVEAVETSHQRELTSQAQSHADALAVRDREAERLAEQVDYERGAKDVERNRSDALADRLAAIAAEYGAVGAKFQRAIQEAAAGDRQPG
jgi:hypothetical protein